MASATGFPAIADDQRLYRRIEMDARDELGHLAAILNQMIERLERAFNRQWEFTGYASHELHTPLAMIQAEATVALQRESARATTTNWR